LLPDEWCDPGWASVGLGAGRGERGPGGLGSPPPLVAGPLWRYYGWPGRAGGAAGRCCLPAPEYWRFRLITAYGGDGVGTPSAQDTVALPSMVSEDAGAARLASWLMERVLLLNATYEPLALVSDRRAVVLVLGGRAEPVAFRPDCAVFHSAQMSVDVPAIVRLSHMVRIPRWARTPPLTRRAVLRRDGGQCAYCTEAADTVRPCRASQPGRSPRVVQCRSLM